MVRDTSRKAYARVKPKLPTHHELIVQILISNRKPMTALEIDSTAVGWGRKIEADKRMAELLRQGRVEECGKRICSVTKYEAYQYRPTGLLPLKVERKTTRPSKKKIEAWHKDVRRFLNENGAVIEVDMFQFWFGVEQTLEWVLGLRKDWPKQGTIRGKED